MKCRMFGKALSVLRRIPGFGHLGVRKSDIETLQRRIGYRFKNHRLLLTALKHRSYVYAQNEGGMASNERLEFLGDAVLDIVVTEHLYRRFRRKREGALTQIKSLIVSKTVLAEKARDMGLGEFLLLSREEETAGGRRRTSIVGDAYEAITGAIYLDGGLDVAREFLRRHLLNDLDDVLANGEYLNFKSALLEYAQSECGGQPQYILDLEEGPDHRKVFTMEVSIAGRNLGRGTGKSKKQAQQRAAREALRRLGAF